jgi:hypothetical protein
MNNTTPNVTAISASQYRTAAFMASKLQYATAASFRAAAAKLGIPSIHVSRRKVLFDEAAVDAWLAARSSGRAAA